MGLLDAILPKNYKNSRVLYEENLDAWREKTEELLNTINLNLRQLALDTWGSDYEFDNDGNGNEVTNLYQYIYNIIDGTLPIDGTSSSTFTINSDGDYVKLDSSGLTAGRTYTFYDASGVIITKAYVDARDDALVPIGSIMMFDDYNGTLTAPDTNIWQVCDGTTISDGDSDLDGITIKDFTGRYPVGFTTSAVGDGSIGDASVALTGTIAIAAGSKNVTGTLAAFDTELKSGDYIRVTQGAVTEVMIVDVIGGANAMTVVSNSVGTYTTATGTRSLIIQGNADHEIDIEHDHDVDIASFDSGNESAHTHSNTLALLNDAVTGLVGDGGDHNHGTTTSGMSATAENGGIDYKIKDSDGWKVKSTPCHISVEANAIDEGEHDHVISLSGSHQHETFGSVTLVSKALTGSVGAPTAAHKHAVNPPNTTSDSSLSATQSIQPESNEVRFYVRYK